MLGQPIFNEGIKIVSYCPLCETQYDVRQAKVLDEHDEAQLVYITCTKCKAGTLAVILLNQMGGTSVGLISDLVSHEVAKFRASESISADEVLAFHSAIAKQKFAKLIGLNKR